MNKTDIKSLTLEELEVLMADWKQPKFRAKQIFDWLHQKQVGSFRDMTNLPRELQTALAEHCTFCTLEIRKKLVSQIDGTVKYLFGLSDGQSLESVVMRYEHGLSICISSQVGCRMGCEFCASTKAGFVRDLAASEMLEQVYAAQRDMGERISHVVMMGIGEPLDNFDHTLRFLALINSPLGAGISMRSISLSTCGIVPRIDELAEKQLGLTLSVSLHSTTDAARDEIMPVNRRWDIEKLLQSCKNYSKITRRRISFEYALIRGKNDSPGDAEALAGLLKGQLCHVNLIPVNEVAETDFKRTDRKQALLFQKELERRGVNATIRRTMGSDINAACGQLRRESRQKR